EPVMCGTPHWSRNTVTELCSPPTVSVPVTCGSERCTTTKAETPPTPTITTARIPTTINARLRMVNTGWRGCSAGGAGSLVVGCALLIVAHFVAVRYEEDGVPALSCKRG